MKTMFALAIALMMASSLCASAELSTSDITAKDGVPLSEEEVLLLALRAKDNRNLALKERDERRASDLGEAGKIEEAREVQQAVHQRDLELIEEYLAFLKKYPRSYAGHNDLGNLYYDLGRGYADQAYAHWLTSASINPDYAPAHNNIGVWHSHFGTSMELPIRETLIAIELGPQQASFHFNLATYCYLYRKQALKEFQCDLPALFEIILKEHKYAAELSPQDYDYAFQYAYTFFGYKLFKAELDWGEAESAWLAILKIRPLEKRMVYRFLTMLAVNSGHREEAEKYIKLLKTVDPSDAADITILEERLEKMKK
jgi:hypothetical protein